MILYLYFLAELSCVFIIIVFVGYFLWTINFGVPFVPSNKQITKDIVSFLKSQKVKKVAELGAGNGRIAIALAKSGIEVLAVEINPILSLIMRFFKLIYRLKNLQVVNANLYKLKYNEYDAIVVYLYPEYLTNLEGKLYKELSRGSYILSNTFKFKVHNYIKKIGKLYIYKVE